MMSKQILILLIAARARIYTQKALQRVNSIFRSQTRNFSRIDSNFFLFGYRIKKYSAHRIHGANERIGLPGFYIL